VREFAADREETASTELDGRLIDWMLSEPAGTSISELLPMTDRIVLPDGTSTGVDGFTAPGWRAAKGWYPPSSGIRHRRNSTPGEFDTGGIRHRAFPWPVNRLAGFPKHGPAGRHPSLKSPPLDFAVSWRLCRTGGTLDGWQEIARLVVGNSCLELLLCLAFVGPVAAMLGLEQPAIMLVGPAEAGKSTALVAVASVWGRHTDLNMANKLGFGVPFNATGNDLEDESIAANHILLAVDETRAAAGGDEREIAKVLVGLVTRWELDFEKGRKTADAGRSSSVPVLRGRPRQKPRLARGKLHALKAGRRRGA
jgi:hypothetical protein